MKAARTPVRLERFRNELRRPDSHFTITRNPAKNRLVLLSLSLTALTERKDNLLWNPFPHFILVWFDLCAHRFVFVQIDLKSLLLLSSRNRYQLRKNRSALQTNGNHSTEQRACSALSPSEMLSRRFQWKQSYPIESIAVWTARRKHFFHLLQIIIFVQSVNRTLHKRSSPCINRLR